MGLRRKQGGKDGVGASAVELALLLPVLMLIFVGIIDFGRGYSLKLSLLNAAREGARYGAAHPPLTDLQQDANRVAIRQRVRDELYAMRLALGDNDIVVMTPNGTSPGNNIVVRVTYWMKPLIMTVISTGNVPVRAEAVMVIF